MANRSSMSRVNGDPSAPSSVVSSHAQSQPLIPTADEIDRAEQNSQIAVGIIRRFVDTIRSVGAFAPIPSATRSALRGDGRRWADAKTVSASPSALEDVRLMPLLQEAKVIDDVVSACGSAEDGTFSEQGASVENETSSSVSDRDRQGVVNAICIPLLTLLAQCYAVLDMVPQTSSAGTGDGMDKNDSLRQRDGRRNNIKQRPKPPRGLLSIADYTDCACMLEFLVYTSILPNLEESGTILPSPQDRVKSLPKSLSGRLHRKSLLWADAVKRQSPSHSVNGEAADVLLNGMEELRKSSQAIGNVIALERFRPMLLPRHVVDIVAALFQSDRYQEIVLGKQSPPEAPKVQSSHTAMLNVFLGRGSRTVQVSVGSQSVQIQVVDPHTRARTYQTLLSGGTKTPQWLRRRVGSLLNSLAATNLRCVVDVFVVAASSMPTDDISAASARLGRVLCSVPFPCAPEIVEAVKIPEQSSNAHRYYQRLFQQLALLLDIASASSMATANGEKNGDSSNFDPRIVAGVLTVWAVIDNLPYHILERFALPMLANGLVPMKSIGTRESMANNGSDKIKRPPVRICVRRILLLLSFAPKTSLGLGKVYHLLLLPLRVDVKGTSQTTYYEVAGNITVIGQLVRVVAAGEDNVVESSRIIRDALMALRMIVHGMACENTAISVATLTGREVIKALSIALIEAVCINSMDIAGVHYKQILNGGKHDVVIDSLENSVELGGLAQEMESRAKVVIVDVVAKLYGSGEPTTSVEDSDDATEEASDLPSFIFCLLLLVYFVGAESSRGGSDGQAGFDTLQLIPTFFQRNLESVKLAAMSMLPLCCEYCSPVTLVLGQTHLASEEKAESFGVLAMIQLVISSVASRQQIQLEQVEGNDEISSNSPENGEAVSFQYMDYACCDLSLNSSGVYVLRRSENAGIDKTDGTESRTQKWESSEDEETLLSICSIVVSLLVALLELGEERNLPKEEIILSSLLPGLQVMSLPGGRKAGVEDNMLSRLESEIAEMASHAVALIRCRGTIQADYGQSRSTVAQNATIQGRIRQAERDLDSDQPPIRARGVVTLRHVARSLDHGFDASGVSTKKKPLIVEIDENVQSNANLSTPSIILKELVRLCVETLKDSESYVYLAAIQTLVAIADANAATVIPLLGRAVSLGVIDFTSDTPSSDGVHDIPLSPLQRIKATEALLFAIRRRGEGVFIFGNQLLELMLFGCHAQSQSQSKTPDGSLDIRTVASTMQVKTDTFFIGGSADNEGIESGGIDVDSEEEERRLRINTGGPVFDAEEDDLVRAGCISIVAELVAALPPMGLVQHCPTLMELGKQVLRLDASRPMRRSAALLCREMYSVVMREFDSAKDENDSFLSFAAALVSSDEEVLHATLKRCLSADDVDIVGGTDDGTASRTAVAVKGKVRLVDPATMARCQEAMEIRSSIDEMGIWTAAKLLAVSKKNQDNNDPATRAIIRRLQQTKKRNGGGKDPVHVQAMQGLRIDGDSLTFSY